MNIYDPKEHTYTTPENTYEIYCGDGCSPIIVDLVAFKEGKLTLQEAYSVLHKDRILQQNNFLKDELKGINDKIERLSKVLDDE